MALTEKQKLWSRAWVANNFDTAAASEAAGYAVGTGRQRGYEAAHNPEVAAYVAQLISWRNQRLDIDGDYVLHRLFEIDRLDIADLLDDQNNFLPIKQWPKAWRMSVSTVELGALVRTGGDQEQMIQLLSKVKLPDKLKNLEMIGKHTIVRAWDMHSQESANGPPPPLQITFEVAEPKADIQVTNAATT